MSAWDQIHRFGVTFKKMDGNIGKICRMKIGFVL